MRRGAKVLEQDRHGEKVLLTPDGEVIKLFRRKRKVSSTHLKNYALRFADNAERLGKLGIRTIEVEKVFHLNNPERDCVLYPLLQGDTLQKLLSERDDAERENLIPQFIDYVVFLHAKGIYFRSLHMGNVLVLPDGSLGVIDVSDMKLRKSSLGLWARVRNFRAFLRRERDYELIKSFGARRFVDLYLEKSAVDKGLFFFMLKWMKNHPLRSLLQSK